MKKIFTLAALAAICFASCSKNEVIVPQTEANAINFGTYVGNAPVAKAQDTNMAYLQKDAENGGGFNVSAYYTVGENWADYSKGNVPNFMKNELVTFDTKWDYVNSKYWPTSNEEKFTFIAYAPATIVWDEDNVYDFTLDTDSKNHLDIIYDRVEDETKKTAVSNNGGTEGTVKFQFTHQMSKVDITAIKEAEYNSHTIRVDEVIVSGFATQGQLNLLTGVVSPVAPNTGSYTFNAANTNVADDLTINKSKAIQVNTDPAALIVCPQTFTADAALTVKVKYTVQEGDMAAVKSEKTATLTSTEFLAGHQYNLAVSISLERIEFTVNDLGITDWTPTNGTDVSVTL